MTLFRTATLDELRLVLDWAAAEGWNPGLDDPEAFFAADPDGFFVAVEDQTPVAAISVVNHTDRFAFLGLYIVLPSHRGQGIGYRLWEHAIAYAGARTIGLDGVPDQQANYAASGFVRAGATTRFEGVVPAALSAEVRTAGHSDIPDLIAREADASGVFKGAYLSTWFTDSAQRKTLVAPDGFLTVRACQAGAKVGPLVADDAAAAERLLRHAATLFGERLIVDVPAASTQLSALCEALQMTPGFETARMYRGAAPSAPEAVFAVATLELG